MDELNILREQMDALKKSLDNSRIVSRKLLLTVMKQKSGWLNHLVASEFIFIPLATLFFAGMAKAAGISIWFALAFFVFGMADAVTDILTVRIPQRDFVRLDLLSLRRKLLKQKKMRYLQMIIMLPLSLAWGAWFLHDYLNSLLVTADGESSGIPSWFNTTMIIVFIVAASVISLLLYRKMQRTNDSLIECINDCAADGE